MTTDLFSDPSDQFEIEPSDLELAFTKVMTMTLAKKLVAQAGNAWTQPQEADLQDRISELVAEAKVLGVSSVKLHVTRTTGARVTREVDLDRVGRERTLH